MTHFHVKNLKWIISVITYILFKIPEIFFNVRVFSNLWLVNVFASLTSQTKPMFFLEKKSFCGQNPWKNWGFWKRMKYPIEPLQIPLYSRFFGVWTFWPQFINTWAGNFEKISHPFQLKILSRPINHSSLLLWQANMKSSTQSNFFRLFEKLSSNKIGIQKFSVKSKTLENKKIIQTYVNQRSKSTWGP